MRTYLFGLLIYCCLATAGSVEAAELRFDSGPGGALKLTGEIRPGDSKKLLNIVRNQPVEFMRASSISLNSPGGSVTEALKVADLIEKSGLMATVESGDTCASACFLLFVSAQFRWRASDATVLIHRPYLANTRTDVAGYNSDLKLQQQFVAEMRHFLEERAIPSMLIDMMMNFPSNDAHDLTVSEMHEHVRHLSPTLEELTIKRCGLSNRNIFSNERDFGGDPGQDDLSCIRKFTISLKFDFTESIIGKERFKEAFDLL